MNRLGELIWNMCDGQRSFGDMLDSVAQTFEVEESEARQDMCDFFDLLAAEGLLENWPS